MVDPVQHPKTTQTVNNRLIQKCLQNTEYANTLKNVVALPSRVV
jgi:hypothetical protein